MSATQTPAQEGKLATHKISLRPTQEWLDEFYPACREIYRSQASEFARYWANAITTKKGEKPVLFKGETEEQARLYTKLPWRADEQPWGIPDEDHDDDEQEVMR